jgi:diguanylate cyclase (GGDEF)-like protein
MSRLHPDDRERYNDVIRPALLEGHNFDSEFRITLPSGGVRWVHALGRPVRNAEGVTVMLRGTVRDITLQREADEHIRRLAHFDALTGLPNRSLFTQLLARALVQARRRSTPVAVLFIDLDGFKEVNDQLGHDAGDALLVAFASRLTSALRRSDVTGRLRPPDAAARLGGDEFVVLIDDYVDLSQVVAVAHRILGTTTAPFQLANARRTLTASIGIAQFPHDGDSLDSLMKRADSAMYAAKQSGKNTFRFFNALPEAPPAPVKEA